MIQKRLVAVFILMLIGLAPVAAQVLDQPVAVVRLHSTENVSQRGLREQQRMLEQQLGRELSESDREELLEAQINEILITQAAEEQGVSVSEGELNQAIQRQKASVGRRISDAEFRRLVEQQMDISWDEYMQQVRDRLIQEKYVMEEQRSLLEGMSEPTEEDIREFYDENATRFTNPAMVRFEHVFVDARDSSDEEKQQKREQAEELYERLQSGEDDFDDLLDASLDDSSFSGGDFGYVMRQSEEDRNLLGQQFIRSVFALEEGETSDGVLESNVGFHIVRVKNRRSPRVLDLDDPLLPGESRTVRDQIRNYLLSNRQQEGFQQALEEVVADLREEADITIYEENLDW
ncbi:MAG: peptidyl-prolyl cis-trans isomerase [Spirochaetota bacterium]